MPYITAEQLTDLLVSLVLISLCAGIAAVLIGQWFHGIAREVGRWFEKRGKPPSAAMKMIVARNLRKRAATLEIEAQKELLQKV